MSAGPEHETISFSYRGTADSLQAVRFDAEEWLAERRVVGLASFDCVLVLSELSTNALQAAPDQSFRVDLTWQRVGESDRVVVSVTNRPALSERAGQVPPAPETWALPEASSAKGRGLAIVRALSDEAEVRTDGDLVTVTVAMTIDAQRP